MSAAAREKNTKSPMQILMVVFAVGLSIALIGCTDTKSSASSPGSTRLSTTTTVRVSIPRVDGLPEPGDPVVSFPPVGSQLDLRTCTRTTNIDNRVLQFARDSATLPMDGEGHQLLLGLIDEFNGARQLTVVGHTSYSDGTPDHNLELSRRRAEAVAELIRSRLPGTEVHIDPKGPNQPVNQEDGTEASRIPNRRVEIIGEVASTECTQ